MILTAAAAIPYVTDAQAAQQYHPPVQQRAAPVQRFAPPRPAPQMHVNVNRPVTPRLTQQQNSHAVNPNLQHVNPSVQHINPNSQHINPNAQHVNPSVQHFNPNAQFNNPNAQHVNPNFQHVNPSVQKFNPNLAQQKNGLTTQGVNTLNHGPGKVNFSAAQMKQGPGGFQQVKPHFPVVSFHNKFWPIFRGPRFLWVGGHRRFFVPIGVLGVAFIGGSYWYPDGYVSIEGPACVGFTPDGCQLQWRMVDFEDGGGEPQCVQYCPQAGPPPAQFATLPPPPPVATGNCQATIFAEPNFAGTSAPTGESQPNLSQSGWLNEISSIQVQAGTWDFFTDENYGGESMRLTAGPYSTLAPEWSKRIGSFMCVQPGPPGA
jgi:hypothetical protein